jgi:hypothetical protein
MIGASAIESSLSQPRVDTAREPASVREGSPAMQRAYQEGLGFEEMLTEELSKSLAETGGIGGEGESEAGASGEEGESSLGAGSSLVSSLLPRVLSEGVVSGGGMGLATQLANEIAGPDSAGASNGPDSAAAANGSVSATAENGPGSAAGANAAGEA